MPKARTPTSTNKGVEFLDDYDGVAIGDLPDRDPLLAVGLWRVTLRGFKVETKESDSGEYDMITLTLDPTDAVDVDEPNEDYEELRQFARIFMMRKTDIKGMRQVLDAFGVDPKMPAFHREGDKRHYDGLEAALGETGLVEVSHKPDKRNPGEDQAAFRFIAASNG